MPREICRHNSVLLITFFAFGNFASAAPEGGMKVWVASDSMRIDPLRSKAYEDNAVLFPDSQVAYQESSIIWNVSRSQISLRSARNETVAFQIVVERTGEAKLSDVNVKLRELVGPGGRSIPLTNIDLFREWYTKVNAPSAKKAYTLGTGWYPDGLLPCLRWTGNLYPSTFVLPFDIPDPLNNVGANQKSQALWVDIYVPADRQDAPPGAYTAKITVTSDAGQKDLMLQLNVWDFMLPHESHLKPNIHTDTEINAFADEMELKYYQLLRKHRLAMSVLGYAPGLLVSDTDLQFDWTKYDARLSKYLDGSAFTHEYGYNGPGYGVPIEFLVLPFDAYPMNLYKQSRKITGGGKEFKYYRPWPIEVPKEGITPEYREVWRKAFLEYEHHFNEHPVWNKTRLIVYLLSLDEAYDEAARERMLLYGQMLKDSGARRLEYRVDGGYPKETMDRLAKVLNISILALGGWNPEMVSDLKGKGVEPWLYTVAGWMDGDLLQARAMSWLAWKLGARSWTLWELDFNSLRAWQHAESYPGENGHGMLVYRGETMGLAEPAASIRLKLLRRGSQDYEYFWLLSQRKGGIEQVNELVNSVLYGITGKFSYPVTLGAPGQWKHNAEEWERVRIKLGDLIAKKLEPSAGDSAVHQWRDRH